MRGERNILCKYAECQLHDVHLGGNGVKRPSVLCSSCVLDCVLHRHWLDEWLRTMREPSGSCSGVDLIQRRNRKLKDSDQYRISPWICCCIESKHGICRKRTEDRNQEKRWSAHEMGTAHETGTLQAGEASLSSDLDASAVMGIESEVQGRKKGEGF